MVICGISGEEGWVERCVTVTRKDTYLLVGIQGLSGDTVWMEYPHPTGLCAADLKCVPRGF